MYREPAPRDPKEAPPNELACSGEVRNWTNAALTSLLLLVLFPLAVAFFVNALDSPPWASVGGGVVAFVALYTREKRRRRSRTLLRVNGGDVSFITQGAASEERSFRLGEVVDVVLDTKTEGTIHLAASPIPALQFANARPGPTVDKARVMLVLEDGAPVAVTPTLLAYMDATEQMGKVRVFLRKHGWVPEDERATDA